MLMTGQNVEHALAQHGVSRAGGGERAPGRAGQAGGRADKKWERTQGGHLPIPVSSASSFTLRTILTHSAAQIYDT